METLLWPDEPLSAFSQGPATLAFISLGARAAAGPRPLLCAWTALPASSLWPGFYFGSHKYPLSLGSLS